MIDVAYLDEAGFAMTLPVCYSWFPLGERLCIPYEAPQGRRVNALGAYFSHGPLAGRFVYQTWASLPPHARNAKRKTPEQVAQDYGLRLDEVGCIDAARLLTFFWHLAERPADAPADWKRARPLMLVLDNYSVHKSQTIQDAVGALEAADIFLVYLPSYAPELSAIEPIWNDVKYHYLPTRSYTEVSALKAATDVALARKAADLLAQQQNADAAAKERGAGTGHDLELRASEGAEPPSTGPCSKKPPPHAVGRGGQVKAKTTNIQRLAA